MPPCEGGGSRCKSFLARPPSPSIPLRRLGGSAIFDSSVAEASPQPRDTPLVKETMPGQRRPEDRFQMEAVM